MGMFRCRACRHLIGSEEHIPAGTGYVHAGCDFDEDAITAAYEMAIEAEVDRRLEERA